MKDASSRGYCNAYKHAIIAKYSDLVVHSRSKKHSTIFEKTPVSKISRFSVNTSDNESRLEAQLALHLSCHSPKLNRNHLTEMLKRTIIDSKTF